jgi:hypothetical protein
MFIRSRVKPKDWVMTAAIIAVCFAAVGSAVAVPVYSNGAINGSLGSWTINYGYSLSDEFTISSPADVGTANVGLWMHPGSVPVSVEWSIGTTPDGSQISSGTASLVNTLLYVNSYGFDIYQSSFYISANLDPGAYYFTLQDALASDGSGVYWDINNGPLLAYENDLGNVEDNLVAGSNVGTLELSSVPDGASTLLLLLVGSVTTIVMARRACAPSRA